MKRLNENRKYFTIPLLVLLLLTPTVGLYGAVPKASVITNIIKYPLPSVPEPVLLGEAFTVEVEASSDAMDWKASISSRFGNSKVELVSEDYNGDYWVLTFEAPEDITPELYDLTLSFSDDGDEILYTQSRSVWVLDEYPDTLTISHISDIHLYHGRDHFANYIQEVNMFDPDLIICSGDVVQEEPVASHWDYLQSELREIEVPSFLIPGNHDHSGSNGRIYQQYGGLLNYYVVLGDFLIVAIDSDLEGDAWWEQFYWVESVLESYPDKVKILSWHHPLFSSEFEDDNGTVTGGNIYGSWENITDLAPVMYFTWIVDGQPSVAAKELLRIIEENDVRVILNGHVHRDIIYVLNDRHHFLTIDPVGGGLPPTVYHGSRLVTVTSDGNVSLDWYGETRMTDPPNAIPVYGLNYWYSSANDYSETSVTAIIDNNLEMSIDNGKLEFFMSSEVDASEYLFSVEPEMYNVYTTEEGYIFVAYFDIPAESMFNVTLTAVDDVEDPEVSLYLADYQVGNSVSGIITVSDSGWGVEHVEASYVNDVMATWTQLPLSFEPIVTANNFDITYPEVIHPFNIPLNAVQEGLILKVEAWDYAGNYYIYQSTDLTTPLENTLSLNSDPSGIEISIDGDQYTAPYTAELETDNYSVSVPAEVDLGGKSYEFKKWSDGSTSTSRTISLTGDISLTAEYEENPEEGGGGIPLPTEYALIGLLAGVLVLFWLNNRK